MNYKNLQATRIPLSKAYESEINPYENAFKQKQIEYGQNKLEEKDKVISNLGKTEIDTTEVDNQLAKVQNRIAKTENKLSEYNQSNIAVEGVEDNNLNLLNQELDLLKKRQNELNNKKSSMTNKASKYRQFGNEVLNTDPNMASKFFSMADSADNDIANIDLARTKALLSSGTSADASELQQLWKDNKRFMTNIVEKHGTNDTAYIEAKKLNDRIENKLKTIAPEIWGEEGEAQNEESALTPEQEQERVNALSDFKQNEIIDLAVDENKDGTIDTSVVKLKSNISDFASKYGFGDQVKKELNLLVDTAVKEIEQTHATRQRNIDTNISRKNSKANQQLKIGDQIASVGMIMEDINVLENNPQDNIAKENLLLSLLRKNSGAAIGADEVVNRMKGSLTVEARDRLEKKLNGMGKIVKGTLSNDWSQASDREALYEFIPYMDMGKFLRTVKGGLNPEAVKLWRNANKLKTTKDRPKAKVEAKEIPKIISIGGWE